MSPTTYTTEDLRTALQETADTVGDLSELRKRLDRRISNASVEERGEFVLVLDDSATVALRKPRRLWSSRPTQVLSGVVLAACIAAIAFVVVRAPWHDSPEPATHPTPVILPTPDPHVMVPAVVRNGFTPGSIPLRNFAGTGTQNIDLGALVRVPNHTYWLYYACSGGDIRITHYAASACSKGYGNGFGDNPGTRHVRVIVGHGVTWHLVLVLQAEPDDNAPGLMHEGGHTPVTTARSYVLRNGRQGWAKSGHGDMIVSIPSITRPRHLAVDLTCSGTGVHVSTFNGQISDDYTNTCWPGYIFQWQHPSLRLPSILIITASPSTEWNISIGPG